MNAFAWQIGGFLVAAAIIFFAGKKLSFYGDLLAEKTGWGKAWVGLILMSSVTSLPELMVGISSSALVKSADLAVGDVLGSCAFNLGILALMDAFVPKKGHLFNLASPSHVLASALGIILLGMVALGIFLPVEIALTPWIGLTSLLFIVIYLFSVRLIYLYELKLHNAGGSVGDASPGHSVELSLRTIVLRYMFFAMVIVAGGLSLPYFAEGIADNTGLEKSFVGTLFLAASTSLPEIAVSIAAIRSGSIDLAVGNLLGSNIFNILILAIDDIFYTNGLLLKDASKGNILSALSAILMSAIVIIGLTYRTEGKRFKLAWDAALIFIVYVINIILLYRLG